jgi:hypothetical protein
VRVLFLRRAEADKDPSLIRLKANLIPRSVDPLRVIDIVGLDRQADGGTHVASTKEIGRVRVPRGEIEGQSQQAGPHRRPGRLMAPRKRAIGRVWQGRTTFADAHAYQEHLRTGDE